MTTGVTSVNGLCQIRFVSYNPNKTNSQVQRTKNLRLSNFKQSGDDPFIIRLPGGLHGPLHSTESDIRAPHERRPFFVFSPTRWSKNSSVAFRCGRNTIQIVNCFLYFTNAMDISIHQQFKSVVHATPLHPREPVPLRWNKPAKRTEASKKRPRSPGNQLLFDKILHQVRLRWMTFLDYHHLTHLEWLFILANPTRMAGSCRSKISLELVVGSKMLVKLPPENKSTGSSPRSFECFCVFWLNIGVSQTTLSRVQVLNYTVAVSYGQKKLNPTSAIIVTMITDHLRIFFATRKNWQPDVSFSGCKNTLFSFNK